MLIGLDLKRCLQEANDRSTFADFQIFFHNSRLIRLQLFEQHFRQYTLYMQIYEV